MSKREIGNIEGDNIRLLAGCGIGNLVKRSNNTVSGADARITDLPAKVAALVGKAESLSQQLGKCEVVDLLTARAYCDAQRRLAQDALPLLQEELDRREKSAADALAHITMALTGKGGNPLVRIGVEALLQGPMSDFSAGGHVVCAIAAAAGLIAWRNAVRIARDNASDKALPPYWLKLRLAEFEADQAREKVRSLVA